MKGDNFLMWHLYCSAIMKYGKIVLKKRMSIFTPETYVWLDLDTDVIFALISLLSDSPTMAAATCARKCDAKHVCVCVGQCDGLPSDGSGCQEAYTCT